MALSSKWYYRYVVNADDEEDRIGVLNRSAWDLDRLSDDELQEFTEILTYGLEQPKDVPPEAIFAFTKAGAENKQNRRILDLVDKAIPEGIDREDLYPGDYEVVWESRDGQVGLIPLEDDDEEDWEE